MLMTPTLDKLTALNLTGMARALHEQMEGSEYQALSFDERLGLLVDREGHRRELGRVSRRRPRRPEPGRGVGVCR